ncbi:hypothetical protein [Lacticaseibacillus nasuensis]|uniref:HTH cro/C1-type domain-containing protein n=1 Tax=Lacticaseibacillus nasuensis JCM 17158 TaxID=1291734 RepID=A0A0R1JPQ7_9LACO|nr:hypothetical protein [Lacticaseibacillus nasuensis]KRK71139.1 hypothetical protein FD02_GL000325 [Lacticaseibacillus nasuensis JCM 17158]
MNELGPAIKRLREWRGYAPKQLYDGVMSRTNYARFERGIIDTSSSHLIVFLRRLAPTLRNWRQLDAAMLPAGTEAPGAGVARLRRQQAGGSQYQALAAVLAADYRHTRDPARQREQWLALAWAQRLNEPTAANPWRQRLLTDLFQQSRWFEADFQLADALFPLLDAPTTWRLALRDLAARSDNSVAALSNIGAIPTGDLFVSWFDRAIAERDWPVYQALLAAFNQQDFNEWVMLPRVMRHIYNAFAQAAAGDRQTVAALPTMMQAVAALGEPALSAPAEATSAALTAWLLPATNS